MADLVRLHEPPALPDARQTIDGAPIGSDENIRTWCTIIIVDKFFLSISASMH
jgi:hypothetical protein